MLIEGFFIYKAVIADDFSEVTVTLEGDFNWFVIGEESVMI